jgi:hypothetical protein
VNITVIDYVSMPLVSLLFWWMESTIDQKIRLSKGLEMLSSITVPFTAEKPRNLQHYISLSSLDDAEKLIFC